MSPLNSSEMAKAFDRQVKRIGMRATLRRNGVDRWCWMFFGQWSSKELYGGLVNPMERLAILSPEGLDIPPEHGKDTLVIWEQPYDPANPVEVERLSLTRAPERIAPAGVVICWKLTCRR